MEKNPEWNSGPAFLKTAVLDPSWAPQLLGFQLPSLFLPGSVFTHPHKVSHWSLCAGLYLSSPIFSFEPGPCVSPQDGRSDLKFSLTNKGKEPTSYWPQAARKGSFLLHTCGRLQEFEALRLFWASVRTWLGLRSHSLFSRWEQINCRPLTPLTLLAAAIKLLLAGKAGVFLLTWWQGSVFLPSVVQFTFSYAKESDVVSWTQLQILWMSCNTGR